MDGHSSWYGLFLWTPLPDDTIQIGSQLWHAIIDCIIVLFCCWLHAISEALYFHFWGWWWFELFVLKESFSGMAVLLQLTIGLDHLFVSVGGW